MSRYYASIQGNRGEATRTGSSHITGHIRSWDTGVRVTDWPSDYGNGFTVDITGGSNDSRRTLSGVLTVEELAEGFLKLSFGLDGFEHYFTVGPQGTVVEDHPLRQPAGA